VTTEIGPYMGQFARAAFTRAGFFLPYLHPAFAEAFMLHVLLVDDDPMVRHTLRAGLEFRQYRVSEAGDGHSALAMLRRDPADLAVLDMNMPTMTGTTLAAAIRSEFAHIKVIFLTGSAGALVDDSGALASWLGAVAVLQKPIRPRELCDIIEQAFAGEERVSSRSAG
jgi:CheY-like chemotaxis protein